MGQFLFGLFAGVVVGLVMEWVIDWAGLLPSRSTSKGKAQKPVQNSVAASTTKRGEAQTSMGASSSSYNPETNGES